ncbi:MAG: PAS domain-containing protein [Cyanobacteria bacterium HKST-UBA02]|nr:PAS domain-containing protein [Cyanobacteria bacterium HKST-UBA02]
MSTYQHEESCSSFISDSAREGEQSLSAAPSTDLEEIAEKIQSLEHDLQEARKAYYRRARELRAGHGPPAGLPGGVTEIPATLSEDLQRQVLMLTEAMPHMVWISDSEGRATHANQRFYDFSGIDRQSDDGWAWVQVLHPVDLDRAMLAGNQATLSNSPFSLEVRCRDREGIYRWHLMHSIPFFDPDSNSTKWFGTTTSIDEQKRAQEDLKLREGELRKLADAIPQIIFVAEADGEISFWNHRWFEYSGLTEDQSASEGWAQLIHPEDRKQYLEEWSRSLESGDTFELEFRIKRAVGLKSQARTQYLWHLARAISYRDEKAEVTRWFGTWTEIEGQKRSNSSSQ